MTDEEYYEKLIELFSTEGWKMFQTEAKERLTSLIDAAPDVCTTNETWQYQRGCIATLRTIVGYENFIRSTMEQAENDAI